MRLTTHSDAEKWTYLEGKLLDDVHEATDASSKALLSLDLSAVSDPHLSTGLSGIALAHAYLGGIFEGRGHEEAAEDLLVRAVELSAKDAMPWLHRGIAGIAWVRAHLTGDRSASVERSLAQLLTRPAPLPYEIMHGTSGLVVYANECNAADLATQIGERIAKSSEPAEPGVCFWTEPSLPSHPPTRFLDIGFAHGGAGAVGALAALVLGGHGSPVVEQTLGEAARWLVAQRLPRELDGWYWGMSPTREKPTKSAWCYGDPGVAWALLLAARALKDAELEAEALATARHLVRRPLELTLVKTSGFCHGAAGLSHILHRFALATGCTELRDGARTWLERALAQRGGEAGAAFRFRGDATSLSQIDHGNLLQGLAGIVGVLLAALDADAGTWDAPFLLC